MQSTEIRVDESVDSGHARRTVRQMAATIGLDDVDSERSAIIATELATNLIRHGGGGVLLVRSLYPEQIGLDLLAIDHGVGIPDVGRALSDGFTTGTTPGTGLGAVRRLSQVCEIDSAPGKGTVVFSRILDRKSHDSGSLEVGAVCCAVHGEEDSGDLWGVRADRTSFSIAVVDGLGHGGLAADAARAGIACFAQRPAEESPKQLLECCHEAMRGTRGAAFAVLRVDMGTGIAHYAGVGNIAARIVSPASTQHLVSMSGIAGQDPLRARQFAYTWTHDSTVIMASDGLKTSWSTESYAPSLRRFPTLLAGMLLRDQARGRDDATVVVARTRKVSG
jgi:anti-sigma regulatory factor (Ser/Thr protein kinase)